MSEARAAFVYLASQSPRRRQLLDQIGVHYQLLLPGEHEDAEALEAERPGELPAAYVERVTTAKLHAARDRLLQRGWPEAPILCADTTVALGTQILGKPRDDAHARATLARLSGRTHRVISAVAVAAGAQEWLAVSVTRVRFAPLSAAWIEAYVQGGEPSGKAGAYAIQGPMAAQVSHLDGSYSGVMGLPLFETSDLLRQAGVIG